MNYTRTVLVCLLVSLFFSIPVFSAHIIGGEITYDCEGETPDGTGRLYNVTMKIYRDCNGGGANFDSFSGALTATVSIYGKVGEAPIIVELTAPRVSRVQGVDNPCLRLPDDICVEQGQYVFFVTLPVIEESYYFVYQRCCRNRTISNIRQPGDAGATYVGEITAPAQQTCNNSPKFKNFPPIALCLGKEFSFSQEAFDVEGDSLIYEFCSPLLGGGPDAENPEAFEGLAPNPDAPPPYDQVTFIPSVYDKDNPLGFSSELKIDRNTGLVTGKPKVWGQFVAGICVFEYRNGELLSVVRRDFQINVTPCVATTVPHIENSDSIIFQEEFHLWSCEGETMVEFDNQSFSKLSIDEWRWEFYIGEDTMKLYDWDVSFNFPAPGLYEGNLLVNPGGECGDTARIVIDIQEEIQADFSIISDTCVADATQFQDMTMSGMEMADQWKWYFGDGDSSALQNPSHLYNQAGEWLVDLEVTVRHCDTIISKPFRYFPAPSSIEIAPNPSVNCGPTTINFNHISSPINEQYVTKWSFGDGDSSVLDRPEHFYDSIGTYSIDLEITSPIGCVANALFEDWVTIVPPLEADFSFTYDTCNAGTITFTDLSQSNGRMPDEWRWSFGDGAISDIPNPEYLYQNAGEKTITLGVALDECESSITKSLLYYPVPSVIEITPDQSAYCGEAEISFNNISIPAIDENYSIRWNFGDGNTSDQNNPIHFYDSTGLFSVALEILAPTGCSQEAIFENLIQIRPQPRANFTFLPKVPSYSDPTVRFQDSSENATIYEWDFNNGAAFSMLSSPVYTFQDTGFQKVTLVVTHQDGCQDSLSQLIDIPPIVQFYIPNAFSPNNDGENDEFLPTGIFLGIKNYHLTIWNRWGDLVFESNDPFQAWTGATTNLRYSGTQSGNYVYQLTYKDARGNPFEFSGSLLVVK